MIICTIAGAIILLVEAIRGLKKIIMGGWMKYKTGERNPNILSAIVNAECAVSCLLTAIFLFLRIHGVIDWSWLWVVSPALIFAVLEVFLWVMVGIIVEIDPSGSLDSLGHLDWSFFWEDIKSFNKSKKK